MKKYIVCLLCLAIFSCKKKVETTKPKVENISESVYASGAIKSKNQYQVFANANGIIQDIMVSEGDMVKKGTPLIIISNETFRINSENAQLAADFADYNANANKLNELKINIDLAKAKMLNDSTLFNRQKELWAQQIGSKVELEQRELAYQNSKTNYKAALLRYEDLNKQIKFSSDQSKKTLQLNRKLESDYTVKSEVDGKVYSLFKKKGEMVNVQTPLAVIGSADNYTLELQIDEYDIIKVKLGQKILVSLDSYKGEVFEAKVDKVYPIMNERSKTFTIEAVFTKAPPVLFPNLTVEANIVIQTKVNVLTIPRNLIAKGDTIVKSTGEKVKITLGLKDYQKAEVLSGINADDELIKPE
jgi:HlyD family secretion protein